MPQDFGAGESPLDQSIENMFGDAPSVPEPLVEKAAKEDIIRREPDENETESRKRLVSEWADKIKHARKYWEPVFDDMRRDQDFASGRQWSKDWKDERYVANLTLRIISQRVAFFYAKNPRFVARRRERILNTVWDGQQSTLVALQQAAQEMMQSVATGGMDPVQAQQQAMQGAPILQDAARVKQELQTLDKIAKTLELLFTHDLLNQPQSFKTMMKMVVRRACTTGVAYVKLGFERVMEKRPEIEARIADINNRLATIGRISADIHDEEVSDDDPTIEQLRLNLVDLKKQAQYIVREGLALDYPMSTAIIPDPKCINLQEFLGADWAAQEYVISPNEVKEIYDIDVGKDFTAYRSDNTMSATVTSRGGLIVVENRPERNTGDNDGPDAKKCCVWEIWNKKDGMVYVICDGYPDFLREPASSEVYTDRFWPWYVLTLNAIDHENCIYPPSDVKLIRDMQMDFNRSRQGLREHRRAARPKTVVAGGMVDEEDLNKLSDHPDNAVIELNGLQPGQKVEDLLQSFKGPPIDPALYDVEGSYQDMLRVTGVQEANLGPTQGGKVTATQTNVAEASRSTAMGSNIDDIDDLLTGLAKTGSQMLLNEVSVDTVKRVVGEGAAWPEMTKQQIADQLWLEVEAGSTGRPNQAQEIANAERVYPLLMQIPGINPEFLARELLRRLDDRLDLDEAFMSMLPSVIAMNGMAQRLAAGPQGPGGAMDMPGGGAVQGARGGANAPSTGAPGAGAPPDQVQTATGQRPPPTPGPPRPPGMPGFGPH
jgi:hypothetical protein